MKRTARVSAKTNLYLDVLGARPDGYHDLATVLVPIPGLDDELTLEPRSAPGLELSCTAPGIPGDARNLVWQAAERFAAAAGVAPAWRFHLVKRIPAAAGLGGGSSDAAAALRLLQEACGKPLSREALLRLAAGLGADVPFFLDGVPALAEGVGERLTPVPCARPVPLLLVNPLFPTPTPWAYQAVDRTPRPAAPPIRDLLEALAAGDLRRLADATWNAFDFPLLAKFPLVGMLLESMRRHGCLCAHVSGSGSTLFGLCETVAAAEQAAAALRREFGAGALWLYAGAAGGSAPPVAGESVPAGK